VLRKNSFSAEQLVAIITDYRNAGLDPQDVAVMALAEKVILDQHGVSQQDINDLLAFGLTDEEVLDIVLTAAARSFYTKVLDALGAEPDDTYLELEPELRAAIMNVGNHPQSLK
jgi:alkylhydroperoxidase family enzyme